NYTITYNNGTLSVTAAAVTITAKDASKAFGATLSFAGTEFTTSGLLPGDRVTSVTLSSAGAAASAAVGSYDIVPGAAVGMALPNYTLIKPTGPLRVPAPAVTTTAKDASKPFGATLTFAGTEFTASGLLSGDKVTSVTLSSAGAAATAAVGSYDIVPSAAVGT